MLPAVQLLANRVSVPFLTLLESVALDFLLIESF